MRFDWSHGDQLAQIAHRLSRHRLKTRPTTALLLTALWLISMSACRTNPTVPPPPQEHAPVIRSLRCFPSTIGPTDSAIVICDTFDQDGDSLQYDWVSDARVRLAGLPPGEAHVYGSRSNSQVVYYGTPPTPSDTGFVQCVVNDFTGNSSGAIIRIPLHP